MSKNERMWQRYWGIRDGHRNGQCLPILWHLALRGDPSATTELGSWFDRTGRIADRFSKSGLAYAAYRRGDPLGAQHLAMAAFNQGDLRGYRLWLWKAVRLGDGDMLQELRRFEVRLPHRDAALIGRKRPYRRSELF